MSKQNQIPIDQPLAGVTPTTALVGKLLQAARSVGGRPMPWEATVLQTYASCAASELDEAVEGADPATSTQGILAALKPYGISAISLPGAQNRASKLLGVACSSGIDGALATELAQIAIESNADTVALLDGLPGDLRQQGEELLAAFMGIWKYAPNGDSETPDEKWKEFDPPISRQVEVGFQKNQKDKHNNRRCQIGGDEGAETNGGPSSTSYSVDYMYLNCMMTDPGKRGRIVPVQRLNKDKQVTHPPPGTDHPWYTKQVQDKDSTDWMNNAYFFEAFCECLKNAGITVDKEPKEIFDFRFNEDFRAMKDDGRKPMKRGGRDYLLPFGWKRFAVSVKGEYDEGDNDWLKSGDGGWAIAYHGTAEKNLPNILSTGFRVGPRQKFAADCGAGVYCTPYIDVAAAYAPKQDVKGHSVQIVLQLRVKPDMIKQVTSGSAFEQKYWVINNPKDMRAYGVLIKGD